MSGEGDGGRYGSITEEADSRDGAQDMAERAWYDQPVRRQNPYFLVFSLVLFSSLLVVGIALNAVGVVTFGPGQYKTEILESIRLCEVDFCGGGVLLGEDGLPIDNEARGSWRNPLDEYQIESCSKERDAAAISEGLSLNLIAQFDNPTNAPVKVEAFHLEVARSSSGEKLVECKPLEVPATVNPAGLNRLDVTCDVTRDQIASLVASYWNGHKSDLAATWSATVTSNEWGVKSWDVGRGPSRRMEFALPRRPAGGANVEVSVDDGSAAAALGKRANDGLDRKAVALGQPAATELSAPPPPTLPLPEGTRLMDLFTGAEGLFGSGGLFPNNPNGMCPGRSDLRLASPSIHLCDVRVTNEWAKHYVDCELDDENWDTAGCEALPSTMRFVAKVVVSNPGDMQLTLRDFVADVWIDGHPESSGDGMFLGDQVVPGRGEATLEMDVLVPWRGSAHSLKSAINPWAAGGSLGLTFDVSVFVRTMGVGVHVEVPEFSRDLLPFPVSPDDDVESRDASAQVANGECSCVFGACQFGAPSPQGKGRGEGCLLSSQCASGECSWLFACE